jgi:hypothetical protein
VKTELKADDKVYFLYAARLMPGVVVRVNRTTVTVQTEANGWYRAFTKRVKLEKISHAQDDFTVVWDTTGASPEGKYYITHSEFPAENKTGGHWSQPFLYYQKEK